jgi:hypothetical protein
MVPEPDQVVDTSRKTIPTPNSTLHLTICLPSGSLGFCGWLAGSQAAVWK